MTQIARCAWAVTLLWGLALCAHGQPYPAVKPLRQTFDVPDVSEANIAIEIESADGSSLYKLQCHSAGYTGDPDFDYSGDFECRLSSIGKHDTFSTLLTEDSEQSRDWESRGRFFAANLQGACAHVPQFGSERSFELRGMTLSLQISEPVFTNGDKLHSLKLTVKVEPNPTARRSIAKIVPVPKAGVPAACKLNQYFVDPATFSSNR